MHSCAQKVRSQDREPFDYKLWHMPQAHLCAEGRVILLLPASEPSFTECLLCALSSSSCFSFCVLILTTTLCGRYCYYPDLTGEETEAQSHFFKLF